MTEPVADPAGEARIFVAVDSKHAPFAGIFEDEDDSGFFYVYDRDNQAVLQGLQVYTAVAPWSVSEDDVHIVWSTDGHKCGLLIRGDMRGIVDLRDGTHRLAAIDAAPIVDPSWLSGFPVQDDAGETSAAHVDVSDAPLSASEAARDRGRHWRRVARQVEGASPADDDSDDALPVDDHVRLFVAAARNPGPFAAFFEDNGETGDFYVTNRVTHRIVQHVQLYTNAAVLNVQRADVHVLWSDDWTRAGIVIWDGLRGVSDFAGGFNGREFIKDRRTPAITNPDWISGFRWEPTT